jgi:hypothetical protein
MQKQVANDGLQNFSILEGKNALAVGQTPGELSNAKTKRILTNRAADRGRNHPDHCGYSNSELAARAYRRE